MYRVCVYDSKAAEDTLFIKEIVIDERGEVQEISESQNFNDYYARISEKEKERPDILVTELNHNARELQLIEQMWKMNPDLQTVYVMDKSHVLTKPVSQSSVVECVNRRMMEDSQMISFHTKRKMLAVNFHYIDSFQRGGIILQSGNKIMISRKYFTQAKKRYDELLAQKKKKKD